MLELQELLVRAGYLDPEEAEKFSSEQPYEARMERAARIFYDYVQNYAPELISPQHEDFFSAAQDSMNQRTEPKKQVSLEEMHDRISLGSLSQSLIGLSRQALSYRREAQDQDYLHKFYEERATPGEIKDGDDPDFEMGHLVESTCVKMERDYLRAWYIFDKEVEKLWPRIQKLINESENDLEG